MRKLDVEIIGKMVDDLRDGKLHPILELIRNDDTLELELRENYISIYYRGGSISKLTLDKGKYFDAWNIKYQGLSKDAEEKGSYIKKELDLSNFHEKIKDRKAMMDIWFANNPRREREYQQLIERENNQKLESNFCILDIEHSNRDNDSKKDSKFDMIAVWRKDRVTASKVELVIIEYKYGQSAVSGKCGLKEHYNDICNITDEDKLTLIENAKLIFKYKKELGLIKNINDIEIDINKTCDINLMFYISAIATKYDKLYQEIEELENILYDNNVKVTFFVPYLAGNVVYDESVFSLAQFKEYTDFYKRNKKV